MGVVKLAGGHSATIGLRMADFRELWTAGKVQKLQAMTADGGDLGDAYPLLAKCIKAWDLTAADGRPLDPANLQDYDELDPGSFLKLLNAVSQYLGGEDVKN